MGDEERCRVAAGLWLVSVQGNVLEALTISLGKSLGQSGGTGWLGRVRFGSRRK